MLTRSDVKAKLNIAFDGTVDDIIACTSRLKKDIGADSESHLVGMFLDRTRCIAEQYGIDAARCFYQDAILATIFSQEIPSKLTSGYFDVIMERVEYVGKSECLSKIDAAITASSLVSYLLIAFPDQISAMPDLRSSLERLHGFVLQLEWPNVHKLSKDIAAMLAQVR